MHVKAEVRVQNNTDKYIEIVNRRRPPCAHIHANRRVKTQRLCAFRGHFMLDLLTQESDKDPHFLL